MTTTGLSAAMDAVMTADSKTAHIDAVNAMGTEWKKMNMLADCYDVGYVPTGFNSPLFGGPVAVGYDSEGREVM